MTTANGTVLTSAQVVETSERILSLTRDDVVAWDTETTGLSPYAGDFITGMSLAITAPPYDGLVGVYVPIGHKRGNVEQGAVRKLVEALAATKAAHLLHHATFDWAFVNNLGFGDVRSKRTVDSQVVRWLQDENQPKGLKTLGAMYLDEDADAERKALDELRKSWWENQTQAYKAVREAYPEIPVAEAREMARRMRASRDWGDLLPHEIGAYAARDATLTTEVAEVLLGGLDDVCDPPAPLAREMEVNHIVFDMTARGVSADHGQLRLAQKTYEDAAAAVKADLDDGFGTEWRVANGTSGPFNPGSGPQVAWLLYEHLGLPIVSRTPKGEPSTDKNALEQLQGDKVAAAVLEYRHWVKAAGSYAKPFVEYLERSADGRIHGMYDTVRTVTGRLSASNPNVMTIPRKESLPEIRAAFYKVPPGIERLGFDLASAELWVMASLTGDPVLTAALLDGRSLHIETMKAVFGTDDKASRYYTLSKNVNYGIAYGAGVDQLATYAAKVGFGPAESQRIARKALNGHTALYRRQHKMSDYFADVARSRGRLPLHVEGRYRHFASPGVMVQYYTALNALVQGGVAEFMKDTMREVYARGYGDLLVLQVHDELVFDAPVGMKDELHSLLTSISNDINPFKYVLTWEGKAWSAE